MMKFENDAEKAFWTQVYRTVLERPLVIDAFGNFCFPMETPWEAADRALVRLREREASSVSGEVVDVAVES